MKHKVENEWKKQKHAIAQNVNNLSYLYNSTPFNSSITYDSPKL